MKNILRDKNPFKVGDILIHTTYYGMTINYFFRVVKSTASQIIVEHLKKKMVYTDGYGFQGYASPDEGLPAVESDIRMSVRQFKDGEIYAKNRNHAYVHLWNGDPRWEDHLD